jgi:Na+-translocating ferredoxin:NAD+ oxidoreductase RNF subunit RnfB
MLFLTAVGAISGLTFILATALVLANKRLYVYEDPRIDVVEEMLPHANCGACGFVGCRPFAEALTTGEALPGKCTVSSLSPLGPLGVRPGFGAEAPEVPCAVST